MFTGILYEIVRPGDQDGDHTVFWLCAALVFLVIPAVIGILGSKVHCSDPVGAVLGLFGALSFVDGIMFLAIEG